MSIFAMEHSKTAYYADFVLYTLAVGVLGGFLVLASPRDHHLEIGSIVITGIFGWSLLEYALHRFVLHGLPPFKQWHAEHHRRPVALICAPTLLSASLIGALVFLPALWLGGLWRASAFTLGVLAGYLAYTVTHHAMHHWRATSPWLGRRKRWHALHHHVDKPGCFGVTSSFWDRVFGSTQRTRPT